MTKILVVPNETIEYELRDKDVEIIVLHKDMERLDIKYAPSLKKIISFSDYVIFGPAERKADIPVLNHCKNLNEIITFGYIKFNTMISTGGIEKVCAWTGTNEIPPTLTSVGSEYFSTFPCYYYDLTAPIEEVDSSLIYAYPQIRECPIKLCDPVITEAIAKPDEVSKPILVKKRN